MAQPEAYSRTKDFTVDFQDETDHSALNAEFDAASNSINDIRDNLSLIQADDGALRPQAVTMESISSAVYDGIISRMAGQDISKQVLSTAENFSISAGESASAAEASAALASDKAKEVMAELQNVSMSIFDVIKPVGSTHISFVKQPPALGAWELVAEGAAIISAGDTYTAGTLYGSNTHTLTVAQMPSHAHSAWTSNAGGHDHDRGNMNIGGTFTASDYGFSYSGAFFKAGGGNGIPDKSGGGAKVGFNANRAWTGRTSWEGDHGHAVGIGNTGDGQAFSLMQKSIALYIYRRVG